jgi:RimJ/RimL family protein N-acetyltransferase
LATELGAAAIADARDRGIGTLVSITLPHNAASRRVMEKLGFAYDHDIVYAGLPHVLYRRDT